MTHTTTDSTISHDFTIRTITLNDPWKWLKQGWDDLCAAPVYSLGYGALFVLSAYLITWGLADTSLFLMILPLTAGLFLLALILTIGLYSISRDLEQEKTANTTSLKHAWSENGVHITIMAMILTFVMLFWMLTAGIVFIILFNQPTPSWDNFLNVVFFSGKATLFLLISIISGATIALFTFAISVVSIPMLMDKQVDFMTAIQTSIAALNQNRWPLMLWAYLIVMYIGIGIITFYIGLLITLPLIGHASWHAYRDLVGDEEKITL